MNHALLAASGGNLSKQVELSSTIVQKAGMAKLVVWEVG